MDCVLKILECGNLALFRWKLLKDKITILLARSELSSKIALTYDPIINMGEYGIIIIDTACDGQNEPTENTKLLNQNTIRHISSWRVTLIANMKSVDDLEEFIKHVNPDARSIYIKYYVIKILSNERYKCWPNYPFKYLFSMAINFGISHYWFDRIGQRNNQSMEINIDFDTQMETISDIQIEFGQIPFLTAKSSSEN